jgi:hypothetical protein
MKHLTEIECVDLLEDASRLSQDRRRHAETCEACRLQAGTLRTVLAQAAADELPEPSPLYWDHFSARVSAAVRAEPSAPASKPWAEWIRGPLAPWAAAAAMAILIMMTVVWRATLHAPDGRVGVLPAAVGAPEIVAPGQMAAVIEKDNLDADEAWAVVRSAAEGLAWEDAQAAGISVHPDSVEGIMLELSAEERAELARLLDTEMKRSGA